MSAATLSTPHGTAPALATATSVAGRTLLAFVRTPQLIVVGTVQGAMFLLIFRYVFGGAIDVGAVDYVTFLVPGFVVTSILFAGAGAAAGVAQDAESGLVDRLKSLPVPRSGIVAGRALADTLLTTWTLAVTTAVGFAVGFRLAGSPVDGLVAFGLCVLFGFAFAWVFITIGLVAGSAQAAQGLSLLIFPLTFVSSAYVPVDTLPGWMQPFAEHQPMTMMIGAVRGLVLGEHAEAVLGHDAGWYALRALAWSAALVAVFLPLAVRRFRRAG